jgi:hypothetical protein
MPHDPTEAKQRYHVTVTRLKNRHHEGRRGKPLHLSIRPRRPTPWSCALFFVIEGWAPGGGWYWCRDITISNRGTLPKKPPAKTHNWWECGECGRPMPEVDRAA